MQVGFMMQQDSMMADPVFEKFTMNIVILGTRLAEVVVVLRLTATTTTNACSVRSVEK
jgi:hypothetical protein